MSNMTPNASRRNFTLDNFALASPWLCRFHIVCVNFFRVGQPMQTQFLVEYGLKSFSFFSLSEDFSCSDLLSIHPFSVMFFLAFAISIGI